MTKRPEHPLLLALALSLGPALALGIGRFAYALLLPAMRADLGLSFAAAGALNTANAAGYLVGALGSLAWARRFGLRGVLLGGCVITLFGLGLCALTRSFSLLLVLRFAAGLSGAMVLSIGGVLVAQLASGYPQRAGLLLGVYYNGIGLGIIVASLLAPMLLATGSQGWQIAWLGFTAVGVVATALIWRPSGEIPGEDMRNAPAERVPVRRVLRSLFASLLCYLLFGMGYIGYMTFNIALLKSRGASPLQVTVFFSLLGLAVCVSTRLWARLLDRFRDGKPMAMLNFLAGIAALLPLLSPSMTMALVSGALFGACFMSVVASTTALVRHNLIAAQWPFGIALFTSVFALGQIVGPTLTGWLADSGGLEKGLLFSGCTLLVGAAVASCQRTLNVGRQ